MIDRALYTFVRTDRDAGVCALESVHVGPGAARVGVRGVGIIDGVDKFGDPVWRPVDRVALWVNDMRGTGAAATGAPAALEIELRACSGNASESLGIYRWTPAAWATGAFVVQVAGFLFEHVEIYARTLALGPVRVPFRLQFDRTGGLGDVSVLRGTDTVKL